MSKWLLFWATNPCIISFVDANVFVTRRHTSCTGVSRRITSNFTRLICLYSILSFRGIISIFGKIWLCIGNRSAIFGMILPWSVQFRFCVLLLGCFSLFLSVVWSFSSHWRWPSVFPEALSFQTWIKLAPDLALFLGDSILIASLTTLSAIIIAIAWFQTEKIDNAMDGCTFRYLHSITGPQIGFLLS